MKVVRWLNGFVSRNLRTIEMVCVLMRIISFSIVSVMGPASPFFYVWLFNTVDAIMLSWCSILRKDPAYSLLNVFWVLLGVVGMLQAQGISIPGLSPHH